MVCLISCQLKYGAEQHLEGNNTAGRKRRLLCTFMLFISRILRLILPIREGSMKKSTGPLRGEALQFRQCREAAVAAAGRAAIMSSRIFTPSAT